MKPGNVTGIVYDRNIHRKLNQDIRQDVKSAGNGEDCAFFACKKEPGFVTAQAQTAYTGAGCGKYAVIAAANQAAAAGAETVGVLLNILLPQSAKEEELRTIVSDAQAAADVLGIALADVKASVTAAVNCPVVTAIAMGHKEADDVENCDHVGKASGSIGRASAAKGSASDAAGGAASASASVPGQTASGSPASFSNHQIVMTKWAGLEGTAILAQRCEGRLRERYPANLIETAQGFDAMLSVAAEAAAAGKSGHDAVIAAAEGGIFRALWTLGERIGAGLEIDLKKILIRQETVEICNWLDVNPYELAANGSLLCATEHGEALVFELEKAGIPAAVIGRVTEDHDRVVRNGEERRFLEPAKEDEIYKVDCIMRSDH